MGKYRKKPVVVDAFQFDGTWSGGLALMRELSTDNNVTVCDSPKGAWVEISTLEGVMRCQQADWMIKGVKGELYPCKPDIFAATYEPVE